MPKVMRSKIKFNTTVAKLLTSIICMSASLNCSAKDISEELSFAYQNSDKIKIRQQQFLSGVQIFSGTLSREFMPKVGFQISKNIRKNKTKNNFNNSSTANSVTESRSLTVDQEIFSGMSGVSALSSAHANVKSLISQYYDNEQKFFIDAIESYLNLKAAEEKIKIVNSHVDARKKIYDSEVSKYELGQSNKINLSIAEANMFLAESDKAKLVADYEKAKSAFKNYFGDLEIFDWPDDLRDLPESIQKFREIAGKNNYQLDAAKYSLKSSKAAAMSSVGRVLPSVSLRITEQTNYLKPEINLPITKSAKDISTSITVNFPIFSQGGAEYAKIRESKFRAREAAHSFSDTMKNVKNSIDDSWNTYDAYKKTLKAIQRAEKSSQIALDGTLYGYRLGQSSLIDIMKVQDDLYNSKTRTVDAKVRFLIAQYQVKYVLGELIARKLNISGKLFSPESSFKKEKVKIIGF